MAITETLSQTHIPKDPTSPLTPESTDYPYRQMVYDV